MPNSNLIFWLSYEISLVPDFRPFEFLSFLKLFFHKSYLGCYCRFSFFQGFLSVLLIFLPCSTIDQVVTLWANNRDLLVPNSYSFIWFLLLKSLIKRISSIFDWILLCYFAMIFCLISSLHLVSIESNSIFDFYAD